MCVKFENLCFLSCIFSLMLWILYIVFTAATQILTEIPHCEINNVPIISLEQANSVALLPDNLNK